MRTLPTTPGNVTRRLIAALFVAVCWGSLPAAAQDKPAADKPAEGQIGGLGFVDVSEVTVVNVDVSVSDKNGPVLGLTRDDFELYLNGKLQEITNFALISEPQAGAAAPIATPLPGATAPAEPPQATAATEPERRREPLFIALYIDNENVLPLNRNRVLTRVTDFVNTYVKEPDQAMLVAYQRSLKILQTFTSNPDDILSSLRDVKRYAGGRVSVISSRRDIEDAIRDESKSNNDMERIYGLIRGFAQEQQTNLKFSVGAIKEVLGMMAGLPGRKVLIYISDGLPMNPGLELYYELQSTYNDPGVLARSQDYESTTLFRSLVTTAAASGVTIHTIDCRGLDSELGIEAENRMARSTMAASIATSNYQDSLVYMAEQTGGLFVLNTNDVSGGLKRIGDDMTTYYWLGYRAAPSGQDRVNRHKVVVKGHSEYRVSYRRSFIEKTLPTQIGDRVMSGLAFELEDNSLGVTLTTGEPAPASAGRWLLPVEVRFPIEKVALIPDAETLVGFVTVYYAARDTDGKQSDLQHTEHQIKVPANEYEVARTKTFVVKSSLLLEPGTYRISVGVRDQLTNQAGFAAARRPVHPEKA